MSVPREVYVLVGGVCDEACLFCHERSEADDDFPAREAYRKKQGSPFLTPETFRARLAELGGAPEKIVFEGGEPTLAPRLGELVRAARDAGVRTVGVLTNGRRLSRPGELEKLVDQGLNSVAFSIHGATAAVHDGLTVVPGSFEECMAALRRALELGRTRPLEVFTHTVLNKRNASETPELLRLLAAFEPIRPIVLSALYLQGSARLRESELFCPLPDLARGVAEGLAALSPADRARVVVAGLPRCLIGDFPEPALRYPDVAELGPDGFRHGSSTAMQGPACSSCTKRLECDGIWKEYADRAGWDDLKPFERSPASGPLTALVGLRSEKDLREVPTDLGALKTAAEAALAPERAGRFRLHEAWAGEAPERIAERALADKPGLVVLSVHAEQAEAASAVARSVKRSRSGVPVLVVEGEGFPRRRGLPRAGSMDAVLLGAGREAFVPILDKSGRGEPWHSVDGAAVRRPRGWVVRPASRPAEPPPSPFLDGTLRASAGCRLELDLGAGEGALRRLEDEIELLSARAQGVTCSVRGSAPGAPASLLEKMRETADSKMWTWILRGPLEAWGRSPEPALDSPRFWLIAGLRPEAGGFDRRSHADALARLRAAAPRAGLRLEFPLETPACPEAFDWALSTGESWWAREDDRPADGPSDGADVERMRFLAYAASALQNDAWLRRASAALASRAAGPRPWLSAAERWSDAWRTLSSSLSPQAAFAAEHRTVRWGADLPPWPALGGKRAELAPEARTFLLKSAVRLLGPAEAARA